MTLVIDTQREEMVRCIHRKCAYNANHIGQLSERMFFSVVNHGGRMGKTLFDNPADYARCIGTVLNADHHTRFKTRVRTFLKTHEEHERDTLKELNPTWESYRIETTDEFTRPTYDNHDSHIDCDEQTAMWASQPPSSGLWADYEE